MIEKIITDAITSLVNEASSQSNILKQHNKHIDKIHFIPVQYRIIGGILQSLNIRFGNFLQFLLTSIINIEQNLKMHELSGKRISANLSAEASLLASWGAKELLCKD